MQRRESETGFRELAWRDVTAQAKEGVARQTANAAPGTATPGLHLLFGPRFAEIGANHARNLQEDRIAIIQAVLERP